MDTATCRNADHCREYDPATKTAAETTRAPLCDPCLTFAAHDVRALLWDILDLEQLQEPSLAQSLTGQPNGTGREPPMPLAGAPDALQAEIVHALTTWEEIVRAACRLSDPPASVNQPWHTTVTRRPAPAQVRLGAAAQRAITILAPRMAELARLEPTAVYPTGCEDEPADLDGVDAIWHLTDLHRRSKAMLGRTRRKFWVPGECWQEACADAHRRHVEAGGEPREWLWRSEPARAGDEPPVWCVYCGEHRTYGEYVLWVEMMVWPAEHRDSDQREAA